MKHDRSHPSRPVTAWSRRTKPPLRANHASKLTNPDSVLPPGIRRVAVEAGSTMSW
jgi:hypothetical protein